MLCEMNEKEAGIGPHFEVQFWFGDTVGNDSWAFLFRDCLILD